MVVDTGVWENPFVGHEDWNGIISLLYINASDCLNARIICFLVHDEVFDILDSVFIGCQGRAELNKSKHLSECWELLAD